MQAASLEPERREYTPLQQEENVSYTDDMWECFHKFWWFNDPSLQSTFSFLFSKFIWSLFLLFRNRTSYVTGSNRDSIDYEDTVNVYPHEDEVNREPAYPEEMYAVVDERKKRQSSAIYQSDDTVRGDVGTSAYENVEFTGLKDEESMASGYHNRDSDIMF